MLWGILGVGSSGIMETTPNGIITKCNGILTKSLKSYLNFFFSDFKKNYNIKEYFSL
jgi:hypothetical protein